jgi:hypothetical protein
MGHRTALITAGSIAVVVLAAAVAIGANLGILNVADSRPVGKLSASAPAPMTEAAVASAAVPVAVPATNAPAPQKYIIKKAGTVSVAASKHHLRLVNVTTKKGWKWALAQTDDGRLTVTFRSGSRTYKFVAVLGRDRAIVARVDHPVTKVVGSSGSGSSASWAPATTASASAAPAQGGEPDEGGGAGADD